MSLPGLDLPEDFRIGDPADAKLFGDIAADAFMTDPVTRWVLGGTDGIHSVFWQEARYVYLPKGLCHRIGDHAAALWTPPGVEDALSFPNMVRMAASIMRAAGIGALRRGLALDTAMRANRPADAHYYLAILAVRPEYQGQGLGHRLLAPVLRAADQAGLPTYLENSNPKNHDFYAGHGFEHQRYLRVRPDAPPLELMLRPPRPDNRSE